MFNLIPISLLIMALGGIVYIFSNHLSELEDENSAETFNVSFKAKFADFINKMPLDNFKSQSLSFTQKLLHRIRILLLKTDNHLMNLIGKISKKDKMTNGNGASTNGEQLQNSDNFWNNISNQKQEEIPESTTITEEPEIKIDLAVKYSPAVKLKISDIRPLKKSSKLNRQKK